MTPNASNRVSRALRLLLLLTGAGFVLTWLALVWLRIGYPFDLEWMESGAVEHVRRILQGQKLYGPPKLEFISYIYPPLYFYLSAGIAKLTGLSYLPLRGLSFVSTLGSLGLIFALVRRETGSAFAGALSACLFSATYQLSGTFFDLARIDALFLFVLLCGLYLLRTAASITGYVLAGLLICLAFMTKQTALVVALPLMLYAVLQGRRRGLAFALVVVTTCGATVAALDALHDGWYTFYTFTLPGRHEIESGVLLGFWVRDILVPLTVASGLSVFYLLVEWSKGRRDAVRFYGLAAVGMFAASWLPRLKDGGALNTLMPAHAALAILSGLAVHRAVELIRERGEGRKLEWALYGICGLQFLRLVYSPSTAVPSARDLESGLAFVKTLSQIDGDVFLTSHLTLATMAGKHSYAHAMSIKDVATGGDEATRTGLDREIGQAIAERRFAAVVVSTDDILPESYLSRYYTRAGAVFPDPGVFVPVAGYPIRPESIYFPKR